MFSRLATVAEWLITEYDRLLVFLIIKLPTIEQIITEFSTIKKIIEFSTIKKIFIEFSTINSSDSATTTQFSYRVYTMQ